MWSLVTGAATYVQYPIHPDRGAFILCVHRALSQHSLASTGYAFRADSRYFVLAERHKSKDTLGVYDAHEAYRLVRVRCLNPISYRLQILTDASRVAALPSSDEFIVLSLAITHWKLPSGMGGPT